MKKLKLVLSSSFSRCTSVVNDDTVYYDMFNNYINRSALTAMVRNVDLIYGKLHWDGVSF